MEKLYGFKTIWINGFQVFTGKIVFTNLSSTLASRISNMDSQDIKVIFEPNYKNKKGISSQRWTINYATNDYNRAFAIKASIWAFCKSRQLVKIEQKYHSYHSQ